MSSRAQTSYELPLGEDVEQLGLGLTKMSVTGNKLLLYNGREKPFEVRYYAKNLQKTVDGALQALINSHEFGDDKRKVIEGEFAPLLGDRLIELKNKLLAEGKRSSNNTSGKTTTKLTPEQQKAVLDWPYTNHIPILECDSRTKKVWIQGWQKRDLNKDDWKAKLEDNGIVIRLGRCLLNAEQQLYSFALDFDDWDVVEAWFGSWENVLAWSNTTRIEWHEDRRKIHMLFLAYRPVANRKIKIKNALLEVRCEEQLLFVHPSIHPDGNTWKPLGTEQIALLDNMELLKLEAKVEFLSEGYMSDENKEAYEKWLDDPNTILGEGQGRHDALKFKINSYYYKYKDEWLDLTDEQRFQRAWDWNVAHCKPAKPKEEFYSLVEWTIETHRKRRDELHRKVKENKQQKKNKPKQADLLVEILEESCKELFHDRYQTPYAAVISGDHIESIPLGSKKFKNYLCGAYYERLGSVPNSESIAGAINVLKYKAAFKGPMIPLRLRVARDGNDILYDLTDAGWNIIRVTPEGWNIEKSPIIFRRYSSQLGQVLPSRTYEDDIFDRFMKLLNIEDNDSKLLLKCYIIALFVPGIQKAILMLHHRHKTKNVLKLLVVQVTLLVTILLQQLKYRYQKKSKNVLKLESVTIVTVVTILYMALRSLTIRIGVLVRGATLKHLRKLSVRTS